MNVIPLPNGHRETALVYLRALLARVEAGEVVAVTCLEENSNGTYTVQGSTTMSRLQTSGALLEAAIIRLQTP